MAFDIDNFRPLTPGNSYDYPNLYLYNCVADSFATCVAANYFADLLNIVQTGDKIWVKTSSPTAGLSFSGTFLNTGSAVSVNWDNTLQFSTQMSDISATTTSYIAVPPAGVITQVYALKWSAITVASAVITFSIGTTAITSGAVTVTVAGDPGTLYTATPTALNVTNGTSSVKAVSGGESTDTAIANVGFKIVCPAQI
jgi:hypothetical protein